jgi:2'-5' RNA ligase
VRLFTGIGLTEEVCEHLTRLLDRLRVTASLRWSAPYNLHITTKFIGEWPENRLGDLTGALRALAERPRIGIKIEGLGWLPNPHSPRILFAGVHADASLGRLAADMDAALEPLGIRPETRAFRPHLTLARIGDAGTPLGGLRRTIAQLESVEWGGFEADRFHLYDSSPGPAGSIYTPLMGVAFTQ